MIPMRPEAEIISDIEKLCRSAGYAHAIGHLCLRDNFVTVANELKSLDLDKNYSFKRLIRTEISTLIGFMIKGIMDITLPDQTTVANQLNDTEKLLDELHQKMASGFWDSLKQEGFDPKKDNPFANANALREPIFYGSESAYHFQYLNFSINKYNADNPWLVKNKGFTIQEVVKVVEAIIALPEAKFAPLMLQMKDRHPSTWTVLDMFTFTVAEVVNQSGVADTIVQNVLKVFSLTSLPCNQAFKAIGDFNQINAAPIIPLGESKYLLFQSHNLVEALYESPFYWMYADKAYQPIAMKNRGDFAENFALKILKSVFDDRHVLPNVKITQKGQVVGEIDILVIYSDRAVILQSKSKRLTIEARKGNDNALRKDFQDAIQRTYDQGWECANLLLDPKYELIDTTGATLNVRRNYVEVFIFCMVSDHYPALAFQARQFLKYQENKIIRPPYVMDIFFLDTMAEFLSTPLHFLSYAHKRSEYFDKIISSDELVILGYHINHNLWIDNQYNLVHLQDDIAKYLDLAMRVRRENIPGKDTPDGILTRFKGTPFGDLIDFLSTDEQDRVLDLGFFLLNLNEKTALSIGKVLQRTTDMARKDSKAHDFTMLIGDTGLTIHCNYDSPEKQAKRLSWHCNLRKYSQKKTCWFGIARHAMSDTPCQLGIMLEFPWEQSDAMDEEVKEMDKKSKPFTDFETAFREKKKRGRNDPCHCGSGKKYKKCCL